MEVSQVPMVLLAEPRMALLEPDENPEAERAVHNCPVRIRMRLFSYAAVPSKIRITFFRWI